MPLNLFSKRRFPSKQLFLSVPMFWCPPSKKEIVKKNFQIFINLILGSALFIFSSVEGSATLIQPLVPDRVTIDPLTRGLWVENPGSAPQPYIIKGINWNPSARATTFFLDDPIGLSEWMKGEFYAHYLQDIPLLKDLNVNTVRVFTDFGLDPLVYKPILDELDRNNIKVIMTAAASRAEIDRDRYDVYMNYQAPYNHFVPTGWMGDPNPTPANNIIQLNQNVTNCGVPATGSCIKVIYDGTRSNWGGIFWQNRPNNWASYSGTDLSGFNKLVFSAKTDAGKTVVVDKFQFGQGGDSATASKTSVALNQNWQEFSMDLRGLNLSNIRGGFSVIFSKGIGGSAVQTVYLDNIYFTYDPAWGGTRRLPPFEQVVEAYKNHPAILMWMLGNEWNMGNLYFGYDTIAQASSATNLTAQRIKTLDSNHPVISVLGDRFNDSSITEILSLTPDVDAWGLNIYRGISFTNLFDRWKELTTKPFYISEFGIDSFQTASYVPVNNHATQCVVQANADPNLPAYYFSALWGELRDHLAGNDNNDAGLGGTVFEFSDQVWKVGNYNAGLGGLVNYATDTTSYANYNSEGFLLDSFPDKVGNEEHFGLVDADRNRKPSFYELKDIYANPWTGHIAIESGAQYTRFRQVYLNLEDLTASLMKFSSDGINWSQPEPFATSKYWLFPVGPDKEHRVYVRMLNVGSGWSPAYSDTIVLDTTKPTVTDIQVTASATPGMVTFSATITDATAGLDPTKLTAYFRQAKVDATRNMMLYVGAKTLPLIPLGNNRYGADIESTWFGTYGVVFRFNTYDMAGNYYSSDKYYHDGFTLFPPDFTPPNIPQNFGSTWDQILGEIRLNWLPSIDNGLPYVNYEIYRNGSLLVSTPRIYGQTVVQYSDKSWILGATYQYAVLARDIWGNKSNLTPIQTVQAGTDNETPNPGPTNFNARPYDYPGMIYMTWLAARDNCGVVTYKIYRDDTGDGKFIFERSKNIATTPALSYTNTNLILGHKYAYQVMAVDAAGNATPSNISIAIAPGATPSPSPVP